MLTADMALRLFVRGSDNTYSKTPEIFRGKRGVRHFNYHRACNKKGINIEIPGTQLISLADTQKRNGAQNEAGQNAFEDMLLRALKKLNLAEKKRKITLRIIEILDNGEGVRFGFVNPINGGLHTLSNGTNLNVKVRITDEKDNIKSNLAENLINAYKAMRRKFELDAELTRMLKSRRKAS